MLSSIFSFSEESFVLRMKVCDSLLWLPVITAPVLQPEEEEEKAQASAGPRLAEPPLAAVWLSPPPSLPADPSGAPPSGSAPSAPA